MEHSCCTFQTYQAMRNELRRSGLEAFKEDMIRRGIFCDDRITCDHNPFAQIISGRMVNPCHDRLESDQYVILQNKPESDLHWAETSPEWVGKASMSQRHKLLSPIADHWTQFNVLTLGMDPMLGPSTALVMLDQMENLAMTYTKEHHWSGSNSGQIGLYFHCYPFNSIHTLHLHIVDLSCTGPTFDFYHYKNLPLNEVRKVLLEEI